MAKRLFYLSGIIAFLLTCAVMWFWYLPMQERSDGTHQVKTPLSDTLHSDKRDTLHTE